MSINVFRAAVFAIVLVLAAGPNASRMCAIWCDPEPATARACEHRGPTASASLSGPDSCPDTPPGALGLMTEDLRRGVSTSQSPVALVLLPIQGALAQNQTAGPDRERSSPRRPLVFSLRI